MPKVEFVNGFARQIPLHRVTIQTLENIFKNTIKVNDCRLRINPHHTGYSYVTIAGVKYPAHRVVKAISTGSNSQSMVVDHLCRNRSCVKPEHLEFVSVGENTRRGTAWHHFRDKTHCVNGHDLSDALISIRPSGTTRRACRECHKLRERARRQHAKEKA